MYLYYLIYLFYQSLLVSTDTTLKLTDAAFPPRPNTPLVVETEEGYLLKWYVPGKTTVTGYIIQAKPRQKSLWKRFSKFIKHGGDTDAGAWKQFNLRKKQAENFQFRIISYNDENLSEPSPASHPLEKLIVNLAKFQPRTPTLAIGNNGNVLVKWTPPAQWHLSKNHVMELELLNSDQKEAVDKEHPYGASNHQENIKKEFSDADADGVIRLEIDKSIIKKTNVTKIRLKIVNIDYDSSKYSKEVLLNILKKKPSKNKNTGISKKETENETYIQSDAVIDGSKDDHSDTENIDKYTEIQKHPDKKLYLAKIDPGFVNELDTFLEDKKSRNKKQRPKERYTASHFLFNRN